MRQCAPPQPAMASLAPASSPPRSSSVSRTTPRRAMREAIAALGAMLGAAAEDVLTEALSDAEPGWCASAQRRRSSRSTAHLRSRAWWCSSRPRRTRRSADRGALPVRSDDDAIDRGPERRGGEVDHDDPIYELLLALKLAAIESSRPTQSERAVEDTRSRRRSRCGRSSGRSRLRPAHRKPPAPRRCSTRRTRSGPRDSDQGAAIVLWMKSLEGCLHAWLAPRFPLVARSLGHRVPTRGQDPRQAGTATSAGSASAGSIRSRSDPSRSSLASSVP